MVDGTIPQERRDFYVYVIFRSDGRPCYVGKGRGGRWKSHAYKSTNIHLRRLYAKAASALPAIKVREHLTEFDALRTEVALIAAIGRGERGPLVNLTNGGDGISGHIHTDECKSRISAATAGKPKHAGFGKLISLRQKGIPKSDAHCIAIGTAARGRKHSEETKARIGNTQKGRKKSPFSAEHCAKLSAAMSGALLSDAHKANIAAAGIGRKATDEARKAIGDAQRGVPCPQRGRKGRIRTAAHCAAISAAKRAASAAKRVGQRACQTSASMGVISAQV